MVFDLHRPVFPDEDLDLLTDPHPAPWFRKQLDRYQMSVAAMLAMMSNPSCPENLISRLLQEAIPAQVQQLIQLADAQQLHNIVSSVGCPPAIISKLMLDKLQPPSVRRAAAANPKCPSWALAVAEDPKHWLVASEVVHNPTTPGATINALAAHPTPEIARAALRHPRCTGNGVASASISDSPLIRMAAAAHPRCGLHQLLQLLQDEDQDVRRAAAENPILPPEYRALNQLR